MMMAATFGINFCFCAGFRLSAWRGYPRAEAAGDRKAPRHEVAGSWGPSSSARYGNLNELRD